MQNPPSAGPRPGDRVRVRRQRWTVVATGPDEVVTLTGIGPENAGAERRLVAPFERFEALERALSLRPVDARTWTRTFRSAAALPGSPADLHTASIASIELMPFQLEPALALRKGLATRVLLADDVGLGKTIQAGLALAELRACGAVTRALVLTPAGLRDQWAEELGARFALRADVIDAREIRRRAAALPPDVNPWRTIDIAVASLDFVKRPEVRPALLSAAWDAVVVDEAHALSLASERGEAADLLCRRAAYVLLLTATPHNGDRRAFAALCRTGSTEGDRLLVFRRTRKDVVPGAGRRIHRLVVRLSEEERRVHQLLARLVRAVRREPNAAEHDVSLALMVLQKRAFSSAHSLHQSIVRRLSFLQAPASAPFEQLLLPIDDGLGETDSSDAPPVFTLPLLADGRREQAALEALAEAARLAMQHETKLAVLHRFVSRLRARGETAIIFTEYRDTLMRVQQALPCSSAILHGGLERRERRAAIDDFECGRHQFLLATDAAGEGLNLQRRCRLVINLELPWNPNRLEQRIGRVDRIGQRRRVHAVHLIAASTGELRILDRLKTRTARARIDAGAADPLGFGGTEGGGHLPGPRSDEATVLFTDLREEVAAQHVRLTRVRRLDTKSGRLTTRDRTPIVPLGRPRGRAARELLGPRLLVLMRTDCEDGCGRIVASHITPVLLPAEVAGAPSGLSFRLKRELLNTLRSLDLNQIDPALTPWTESTVALSSQLWIARRAREEAILRDFDAGDPSFYQPGLFDRRSERARDAVCGVKASLREELTRRLEHLQANASCRFTPARPMLVLLPRHR